MSEPEPRTTTKKQFNLASSLSSDSFEEDDDSKGWLKFWISLTTQDWNNNDCLGQMLETYA